MSLAAAWTRPSTVQKALLLRQSSKGGSNNSRQLCSGQRVSEHPAHLARALPAPRPMLLPFLHPAQTQAPQRRASSTLVAAAQAVHLDPKELKTFQQRTRYYYPQPHMSDYTQPPSPTTEPFLAPSASVAINVKRSRGRPKKDKRPASKTDRTIATLTFTGSTYQEHSIANTNGGIFGLEPAPFPESILTPLTNPLSTCDQYQQQQNLDITAVTTSLPSYSHQDLESFESQDHNTDSTVYRGTLFEYQTQQILRNQLGIYTHRSAGNGDEGVDLRGKWPLPISASSPPGEWVRHLNVIVQCKKMTSKIGPRFVRELQGTLSYESQPTMAILAVASDFTKQALVPCLKSLWPMALAVIDIEKEEVRKLMWNRAAEQIMHGVQIGIEWKQAKDGELVSRPVLCFEGHLLERLPGPLRPSELEEDNSQPKTESSAMTKNGTPAIALGGTGFDTQTNLVRKKKDSPSTKLKLLGDISAIKEAPRITQQRMAKAHETLEQLVLGGGHVKADDGDDGDDSMLMTEEYAEYIEALKLVDRLLLEVDSEQEFSIEDWAIVDNAATDTTDRLRIQPSSSSTDSGGVRILHPIDLSTLVQPYTQIRIDTCS